MGHWHQLLDLRNVKWLYFFTLLEKKVLKVSKKFWLHDRVSLLSARVILYLLIPLFIKKTL